MSEALPLAAVRELRWWVAGRNGEGQRLVWGLWVACPLLPRPRKGAALQVQCLVTSHHPLPAALCLAGPLTALQAAGAALRVLLAMAGQQPAVDPRTGEALFPLPLAHRQMASAACLPHIAQVLLTGEPALVDGTAALLLKVLQHNPGES